MHANSPASADYVIIGGGTAGAIISRRLADVGAEVVLIEAGGDFEDDPRVLELARWPELEATGGQIAFALEPQSNGNDLCTYLAFEGLGGCSSHNGCIAFLPPSSDLYRWGREVGAGWNPDDLRTSTQRLTERIRLEDPRRDNACQAAFVRAAVACGLPEIDFAAPSGPGIGAGWLKLNKRGTTRLSSAVAYLFPSAELPPNLRILTHTRAEKVIISPRGRAQAVRTSTGVIGAREEIILCAGALRSPQILMLSGVGPARHLKSMGIDVRVNLPVGDHLIDHPEGVTLWEPNRTLPTASDSHLETALFASGPEPGGDPEIQIIFSTARFDATTVARGYPTAAQTFSMHPNVTHPRSEGTVRLGSSNAADHPLVDPGYFTDPEGYDERCLLDGLELCRLIADQEPLKSWIKRELAPGRQTVDRRALRAYLRATHTTVYHPAGTCRMGSGDDDRAVVDTQLRVRGIDRLRTADASVFPSMPYVNPCLTVMLVGERCAELILGQ